jgi:hypothetical protein
MEGARGWTSCGCSEERSPRNARRRERLLILQKWMHTLLEAYNGFFYLILQMKKQMHMLLQTVLVDIRGRFAISDFNNYFLLPNKRTCHF